MNYIDNLFSFNFDKLKSLLISKYNNYIHKFDKNSIKKNLNKFYDNLKKIIISLIRKIVNNDLNFLIWLLNIISLILIVFFSFIYLLLYSSMSDQFITLITKSSFWIPGFNRLIAQSFILFFVTSFYMKKYIIILLIKILVFLHINVKLQKIVLDYIPTEKIAYIFMSLLFIINFYIFIISF